MGLVNGFDEASVIDDHFLLNFSDDGGSSNFKYGVSDSSSTGKTMAVGPGTQNDLFPGPFEDLEWLMDEEAFPPLESCFGVLSDDSEFMLDHVIPIAVLDTIKTNADSYNYRDVPVNHPKGTRCNKRRRRMVGYGDLPSQLWSNNSSAKISQEPVLVGRRCQHCLVDKTPQWRAGPMGPKTLCNACGVRYKSGRLHPEYRPACSPTFSNLLHSNSHKKVMEMRMKKQGD